RGSVPSTSRSPARLVSWVTSGPSLSRIPSRKTPRAPLTSTNARPSAAASHRQGATDMVQTVFSCSIARHAGDVDVEVIGAMDRSSAGQFRNQLLTLAKEHPASIAIDMDDLALVDSSCVAVLVEAWRFAVEHGI